MTLSSWFPCSVGSRTGTSAAVAKLESQEQINPWGHPGAAGRAALGGQGQQHSHPKMVLLGIQSLWGGQQ